MQLFHKSSTIKRGKLIHRSQGLKLYLIPVLLLALSGCGGVSEDELDLSQGTAPTSGRPVVNVVENNLGTHLNWNDTEAYRYRVFYWQGNDAPQEHMTASTTFTLPSLSSGAYTVIVEGYDSLGSSLFSVPVTAVVS